MKTLEEMIREEEENIINIGASAWNPPEAQYEKVEVCLTRFLKQTLAEIMPKVKPWNDVPRDKQIIGYNAYGEELQRNIKQFFGEP